MRSPNEFPHDAALKPVIVTDNGYRNAGSRQGRMQQDSTARVNDPIRGPFFSTQLAQNNIIFDSPTQDRLETMTGPAENGSMALAFGTTGDPNMAVAFIPKGMNNSSAAPGNLSLTDISPALAATVTDRLGKLTTPGWKEQQVRGALRRVVQDGQEYFYNLTKGLPANLGLRNLAGTIVPAIKNIETAVSQAGFGGGLGGLLSMFSLPGSAMNMGQMKAKLTDKKKKEITKDMPPEVADAFNNMIELTSSADLSYAGQANFRCNSDAYMENVTNMFSQCRTVDDLVHCFTRAQVDPSIRGLETLPKNKVTSETAFGAVELTIDYDGNLGLEGYEDIDIDSLNELFDVTSNTGNTIANTVNTSTQTANSTNKSTLESMSSTTSAAMSLGNIGSAIGINQWKEMAGKVVECCGRTQRGKMILGALGQQQAARIPLNILGNLPSMGIPDPKGLF